MHNFYTFNINPSTARNYFDNNNRDITVRITAATNQLNPDQYVGFQMHIGANKHIELISSNDVVLSPEDYEWIYEGYGSSGASMNESSISINDYSHHYVLPEGYINKNNISLGTTADINKAFEHLSTLDTVITYYSIQSSKGVKSQLIFSFKKDIGIQTKALISWAFPASNPLYRIDDISDKKDDLCIIDSKLASTYLHALLHGFLNQITGSAECSENNYRNLLTDDKFMSKLYKTPIEELKLSVRTYNCLKRRSINSIGALAIKSDEELTRIRNLGRKGIEEIYEKLGKHLQSCKFSDDLYDFTEDMDSDFELKTDYFKQLDNMIGLTDVKSQVRKITAYARMLKSRTGSEKSDFSHHAALNMCFMGNPGTAKTTVARILAGLLYNIGLLDSPSIVEVGRANLVGKYVGHTAEKVKELFQESRGKLIFIDEAYSLIDNHHGSFGDEAINTIVQEMENNREDTVVIFAGYPNLMEEFFSRNPGLKSRVPFHINFEDYSASEMAQIAVLEASKNGFKVSPDALPHIEDICEKARKVADAGNGRFSRNLVEDAIFNFALREYGADSDNDDTPEYMLTRDDFNLPERFKVVKEAHKMGFLC